MSNLTVKAEDVLVDDHIYMGNGFSKNPNFRWARVRKVKHMRDHNRFRVRISAGDSDLWFNAKDQVTVQRFGF
jgi:hypothetical protein